MTQPWLIVGLGNPGARYEHNRHNLGHMVVERLAARTGSHLSPHKSRALVAETHLGMLPGGAPGPRVVLAKPGSFMNVSGGPVKALVSFYGVDASARLLVIHDELDLPEHVLRLKRGGGEGGHNGLRSISSALGTRDYARLRVGIGRPPGQQEVADFVLRDLPGKDRAAWGVTIEEAADVVEAVVAGNFEAAQNVVNAR